MKDRKIFIFEQLNRTVQGRSTFITKTVYFQRLPKNNWVYGNLSKEYNGFSRSFFEIWSFYLILTRQNGPLFLLNQNRFQN